jgi:hypothetical protein
MMEKATPVEMREALEIVRHYVRAGILFIPVPVLGPEDCVELQKGVLRRLDTIEKAVEEARP